MSLPVLFDFDGTLMDTEPAIHESYREVFRRYRTEEEFDEEKQVAVLGPSLDVMMSMYFPGEDVEELKTVYRNYQNAHMPELVRAMPHAREVLQMLKERGCPTAIVSTRKTTSINLILETVGMADAFDVIIGYDMVTKDKPDPEGIRKALQELGYPADTYCVYVGDSPLDIQAGRNAGAWTVAMISNLKKEKMVLDEHPDRVIYDLSQLADALPKEF